MSFPVIHLLSKGARNIGAFEAMRCDSRHTFANSIRIRWPPSLSRPDNYNNTPNIQVHLSTMGRVTRGIAQHVSRVFNQNPTIRPKY